MNDAILLGLLKDRAHRLLRERFEFALLNEVGDLTRWSPSDVGGQWEQTTYGTYTRSSGGHSRTAVEAAIERASGFVLDVDGDGRAG